MSNKAMTFEEVKKMRRGVNSYEVYNFPFMDDVKIAIRVLTQDDILQAGNIARNKAKLDMPSEPNAHEIQEYTIRQLLLKAVICVPESDSEELKPFFADIEQIGEMSMDEIYLLVEHYNEVQEKYAPVTKLETPEDFDALIDEVKKKSTLGMSLSTFTLRKLVHFLVADIKTLQSDNGTISLHSKPSEEKPVKKKKEISLGIKMEEK